MTRRSWLPAAVPMTLSVILAACSTGGQPSTAAAPSIAPSVTDASLAPSSEVPGGSAVPRTEGPAASAATGLTSDPLHALTLRDVRNGEEFTLGLLAANEPVLLETMAIWCTNCRAQQHNVVAAHELVEFHSISLDVDPSELPNDLAQYAEREGFDWRFAVANAELVGALRDRFGTAVSNPPSMPKILFRTDGTVEMVGLGHLLSPEELAAAISS